MFEAYLVDAVRTPVGRRGGGLSAVHPADLGALVITALLGRVDVDPVDVDEVIVGCVDTACPQAGNRVPRSRFRSILNHGGPGAVAPYRGES